MSERARVLAEQLRTANAAFIDEVEALSEAQWRTVCPGEEWTAGVVAYHVGLGHETIARHIDEWLSDVPPEPEELASVHLHNAEDAGRAADSTKPETVALLSRTGAAIAERIQGLTDEQLARRGRMAVGVPELAVDWLAGFAVKHIEEHRDNIRAALTGGTPGS